MEDPSSISVSGKFSYIKTYISIKKNLFSYKNCKQNKKNLAYSSHTIE